MNSALQLSNTEQQMLQEVFDVFAKYKSKTRKFGVQLVHSHFPLKKGEILLETHDKEKRILTIVPKRLKDMGPIPKATAWSESSSGQLKICMFCCDDDGGYQNHPDK